MAAQWGINQTYVLSNAGSIVGTPDGEETTMAASVMERVGMGTAAVAAPGRVRTRPLRPGRGTGRQTRPQARPARPVAAPQLAVPQLTRASSPSGCRVERPSAGTATSAKATSASAGWRLTERGIALVLATGLAIAAAAVVVVTLTALRVTGDSFPSSGQITTSQH
jgi:hypothetical protein